MKQGEMIAYGAILFIMLSVAWAIAGPNTKFGQAWNGAMQNSISQHSPATGSSIIGGPSLSAAKIDAILSANGSPATGSGQTFYQDSVQYNIDDATALAFFHRESSYGEAGAATQTLNMGNIVCTPGYSCIGRFRSYPSWQAGIDDWYQLIKDQYVGKWGCTTVESIIPHYAPNSDGNSESSYIAAVQADVQSWRQR